MPLGVKLVHHKGVRRGAITSVKIFGRKVTFKVVTYSTSKTKTTFNDILKEGNFYGIKFWSHRHFIEKSNDGTVIRDELNFTTKNKLYDSFLWLLLFDMFIWRSIKTKVFFFLNKQELTMSTTKSWPEERAEIAVWLSGFLGIYKKWVDKILDNDDHEVDKGKIIDLLQQWIDKLEDMKVKIMRMSSTPKDE